jgi:hypothetical protein
LQVFWWDVLECLGTFITSRFSKQEMDIPSREVMVSPQVAEIGSSTSQNRVLCGLLRTGRPRSRNSSRGRVKNFLFSTSSRPALGSAQPPIQWVMGALVPGVKRQGREADHSPSSAEVKKMWIYTSTPPYAFMA